MQKIRREKKSELKNMQETLLALKEMQEVADRKKAELVDQQQEKVSIACEQDNFKQLIRPIHVRLKEIQQAESKLSDIMASLG